MAGTLLEGRDPGWAAADPIALLPDWRERIAEIEPHDATVAEAAASWGAVIAGAADAGALAALHTAALGRERGVFTRALAEVPSLPLEERKHRGRALNAAKRMLADLAEVKRKELETAAESATTIDVTIPGRKPWVGHRHVLAQIRDDLLDLFHGLGYSVYTSPEPITRRATRTTPTS
jgi:phenylalanyl-tRNA synthetase alpha chain